MLKRNNSSVLSLAGGKMSFGLYQHESKILPHDSSLKNFSMSLNLEQSSQFLESSNSSKNKKLNFGPTEVGHVNKNITKAIKDLNYDGGQEQKQMTYYQNLKRGMIKSSFTESLKKELMQREDSTHLQVNDSFNLNMHELVPGDKDEDLQFTLLKINSNKKQNNIGKVYAYGNLTPIQEIENSDLK